MGNGSRKRCETNSISHGEEGAQIERPLFLVGREIEMKVIVDDGGDVIGLAGGGEKPVRENGEILRLVEVQPVRRRSDDVHDEKEASSDVGGGEPGTGQWASKVSRYRGPVQAHCADTEPVKPRSDLLRQYGAREYPADPRDGGQHLE